MKEDSASTICKIRSHENVATLMRMLLDTPNLSVMDTFNFYRAFEILCKEKDRETIILLLLFILFCISCEYAMAPRKFTGYNFCVHVTNLAINSGLISS